MVNEIQNLVFGVISLLKNSGANKALKRTNLH
jgi:hypothetical protein